MIVFSNVVDIFIETKNINKFINSMLKKFNLTFDNKKKYLDSKKLISFNNDDNKKLLNNNKFDCFFLKTYGNTKNEDFNI